MLRKKEYIFECSDGVRFSIPLELIAKNMAEYYAEVDCVPFETAYDNVVMLFNESDYEVEQWARNNMDWTDVKDHATIIDHHKKQINMQDEWTNPVKKEVK